eukprot:Pgem_evm1s19786
MNYYLNLLISASFVTAESNFKIGIKTLVLSNNHYLDKLCIDKLEAYGVNYDLIRVVNKNSTQKTNFQLNLYESDGQSPQYNSIVYLSSSLAYTVFNPLTNSNTYPSALSVEEWDNINSYKAKFGVRSVSLESNADVDSSLILIYSGSEYADVRFTLDGYVNEFNSNIKENATFKLGKEYTVMDKEVKFFQSRVKVDPDKNVDGHIKPFLEIKNQTADEDNPVSWSVGAFIKNTTGKYDWNLEEMHFLFTANSGSHHGIVLFDIWFPWITKGMFLGQRRIVLNTHIDDYLLSTDLFNKSGVKYRNSATDLQKLARYQASKRLNMPKGSNFTIEMAFNGYGYANDIGNIDDGSLTTLNEATIQLRDKFLWVSHTYTHLDLYCVESNCDTPTVPTPSLSCYDWSKGACNYPPRADDGKNEPVYPESGYSPYELIVFELTRNQYWAKHVLFRELNSSELELTWNWSPHSIVTPRISGLNYTVAIRAMLEAGLFTAVGDNSRKDLKPDSEFHGFNARPKAKENGLLFQKEDTLATINGRDALFVIPRKATRIYYDVSTPEENADEHNTFYGPNCEGCDQDGEISFMGLKCNKTSFKYEKDLSFQEMLERESYETAVNLLSYKPGNNHIFIITNA